MRIHSREKTKSSLKKESWIHIHGEKSQGVHTLFNGMLILCKYYRL